MAKKNLKLLKPARPGLIVRDPRPPYLILKAEGEVKDVARYWNRRIKDGDVVVVDAPPAPPAPKKPPTETKPAAKKAATEEK